MPNHDHWVAISGPYKGQSNYQKVHPTYLAAVVDLGQRHALNSQHYSFLKSNGYWLLGTNPKSHGYDQQHTLELSIVACDCDEPAIHEYTD